MQQNSAGTLIRKAWHSSGLSLREIARRAGTSHATLSAYIKGKKSPSVDTLEKVIAATDFALDFDLRPRIRKSHGLSRDEELQQVLRLAGEFPAKPSRNSNYPIFPRG